MPVKKICGIETEYGILHHGLAEFSPAYSSSILITSYLAAQQEALGTSAPSWDFNDEMPGNDARGFLRADVLSPEMHPQLANAVLLNGARYYVDHAHPEMSSPECSDALAAVRYDCAGDLILQQSMATANAVLPDGEEIVIYKNNSDGKGNSYGCHENYLMDRAVPFSDVAAGVMPHFITRQIFCGAGKVGFEASRFLGDDGSEDGGEDGFGDGNGDSKGGDSDADRPARRRRFGFEDPRTGFQISSRADFFEEQIGLETTIKRPIVNTRDEPHCDYRRFRRLHVIIGDSNMSQVACLLKLGTTAIVLAMIEDDFMPSAIVFEHPVVALRTISADLSLRQTVPLATGEQVTALDIQWEFYEQARKFSELGKLEPVGHDCGQLVLDRWEQVLSGLETDPQTQAGVVDWIAKHQLIDQYRQRHDLGWDSPRLKALDLQYHDLRPNKGLAYRLGLEQLVSDQDTQHAADHPPPDTRAYFRGECLRNYGQHIVAANWDSVLFEVGDKYPQRASLPDPNQGTAEEVAHLFEAQLSPQELLAQMQQQRHID